MSRKAELSAIAALLALGFGATVFGTVWYVDSSADGTERSGESWCSAFATLQEALDLAEAGDEIRVAAGTYFPGGDNEDSFQLLSEVVVIGAFGGCGAVNPDERDLEGTPTVLSGDIDQDDPARGPSFDGGNSRHIVKAQGVGRSSVLDGFVLVRGYAASNEFGGAMAIASASPTIVNCTFRWNTGESGGAVDVDGGAPLFQSCSFEENEVHDHGGAVFIRGGSLAEFEQCTFEANCANDRGGAVRIDASSPMFRGCVFRDNEADPFRSEATGGAILNINANSRFEFCEFVGNNSACGGAVGSIGGRPVFLSSRFESNWSRDNCGGGAIFTHGSSPSYIQCEFLSNEAEDDDGGAINCLQVSELRMAGCNLIGNSARNRGGAVALNEVADARINQTEFAENHTSFGNGGAVWLTASSDIAFCECDFIANEAGLVTDSEGGAVRAVNDFREVSFFSSRFLENRASGNGGAIDATAVTPFGSEPGHYLRLVNSVFVGNRAETFGGALYAPSDTTVLLDSSTLSYNNAELFGGILIAGASEVTNSIFWFNSDDNLVSQQSQVSADDQTLIAHCFVHGIEELEGVEGNIGVPSTVVDSAFLFVDGDGPNDNPGDRDDDISPTADSPVIDQGDATLLQRDICDYDEDGDTAEPVPFDLENKARVSGHGLDMGPLEGQDCNGNGILDIDEILVMPSLDCNDNQLLDSCESDLCNDQRIQCADCNGNGTLDICESVITSDWVGGANCGVLPTGCMGPPVECWQTEDGANDPNWCPAITPNNGGDLVFDVHIEEKRPRVVLNISPSIRSFTLGSGASLEVGACSGASLRAISVDEYVQSQGYIRATDGRRLTVFAPVIEQGVCGDCRGCTGVGILEALNGDAGEGGGSILEVNGAVVLGGIARGIGGEGGGRVQLTNGAELVDVCVQGGVVPDGQLAQFSGTVVNNGVFEVAPLGEDDAAFLVSGASAVLRGDGGGDDCLRLGGESVASVGSFTFGFTNAAGHIIDGAGTLFGSMHNAGMVRANSPGASLVVSPPGGKTNNGVLIAENRGVLRVADSIQGKDGVLVADGGVIQIGAEGKAVDVTARGLTLVNGGAVELRSASETLLSDDVSVSSGGRLTGDSENTDARLSAREIRVEYGQEKPDDPVGGVLAFGGSMMFDCERFTLGQKRTLDFFHRRKRAKTRIRSSVYAFVGGDFSIFGCTDIIVDSTEPVQVEGSYVNGSTCPDSFDWRRGGIVLSGSPASFEVGGEDRGPECAGFGDAMDTNYAFHYLEVVDGAAITFENAYQNAEGAGPLVEALYVDTLVLRSGATILLEGTRIYFAKLVDDGATILASNGGELVEISDCCVLATTPENGLVQPGYPHPPESPTEYFPLTIAVDFACDSAEGDRGDFVLQACSAEGPEPIVTSFSSDGAGVEMKILQPPGEGFCIEHIPTGYELCTGQLPGDVSGDRLSGPEDLLAMIDCILGAAECQTFQCDIDRDEACDARDIVSLLHLLDGTGGFESWAGVALEDCPP